MIMNLDGDMQFIEEPLQCVFIKLSNLSLRINVPLNVVIFNFSDQLMDFSCSRMG